MTPRLFSAQFFRCLISSETSNRFSLSDYFEDAYSREFDFCKYLPYELCHRSVSVTSPFSYEAAKLDALCILHTSKGAGRLYCENAKASTRDTTSPKARLPSLTAGKTTSLSASTIFGSTRYVL